MGKRPAIASLAVLAALAVGCGSVQDNQPEPAAPLPMSSEAVPANDLGAGTPGAPCATSRLGKRFTLDGVVYVCKGPKPYTWRKEKS